MYISIKECKETIKKSIKNLKLIIMKKLTELTLEILSTEELMTVKGGGAPIVVIPPEEL